MVYEEMFELLDATLEDVGDEFNHAYHEDVESVLLGFIPLAHPSRAVGAVHEAGVAAWERGEPRLAHLAHLLVEALMIASRAIGASENGLGSRLARESIAKVMEFRAVHTDR